MFQIESSSINQNTQDEPKKKKKLYNPFQNDKDYYSVDEKLPIQVKSKIPHWVPTKNSDIFEVRKVMASEKEQIRNINRSLGVYKQDNKILVSKKILEEEAQRTNQKIRSNLTLKVMKDAISKQNLSRNNEKSFPKKTNLDLKTAPSGYEMNKSRIVQEEKNESYLDEDENEKENEKEKEKEFDLANENKDKKGLVASRLNDELNKKINYAKSQRNLNTLENVLDFRTQKGIRTNSKARMSSAADSNYLSQKANQPNENYSFKKSIILNDKNDTLNRKKPKDDNKEENYEKQQSEKNFNAEHDDFDTLKANTSVLITSLIHETPAKVDHVLRKGIKKEHQGKFETAILQALKEENEQTDDNPDSAINEKNTKHKSLKPIKPADSGSFEPPITSSLRYSVREYIDKTREVVSLRHSVEIKKQTALKIEEDYSNQVQSVKESIALLKQTKLFFEDDFLVKFDKYIKHLRLQREKEINELNSILDFKSQLELDIQKLESRRFKTKARLNLYREYRDFLICMKERTVCLPVFFTENENYKNNVPNVLEFNETKDSISNPKRLNASGFNLNSNWDYSDLDSDMDSEARTKVILEREKVRKVRDQLLNQFHAISQSVNKDMLNTNFNTNNNGILSMTRRTRNVFNTISINDNKFNVTNNINSYNNFGKYLKKNTIDITNNNSNRNSYANINFKKAMSIRESINILDVGNSNANEISDANVPHKGQNVIHISKKKSTKGILKANWPVRNSKSLKNPHKFNLNNNFNTTDNFQKSPKFRVNANTKELLDPTFIGVDQALIYKFNNYISKPIYETSEELNEDLKKLQLDNINLLKKLASLSARGNMMKQGLAKMRKEDQEESAVLELEVLQREERNKKIKELNLSLQEEKSMLIGIGNGNYRKPGIGSEKEGKGANKNSDAGSSPKKPSLRRSLVKAKLNQVMLYSRVAETFNLVLDMPLNLKQKKDPIFNLSNNNNRESSNNNNLNSSVIKEVSRKEENKRYENSYSLNLSFNSNDINNNKSPNNALKGKGAGEKLDKEGNLLHMLRVIEKSVDYLLAKHANFLKDPKKVLIIEKLKIEVEKERKVRKAIETRLKDEKRREIISQAIIERNSIPVVLPNKRFGERVKPVERKVRSKSVNKSKEDDTMQDMISFL